MREKKYSTKKENKKKKIKEPIKEVVEITSPIDAAKRIDEVESYKFQSLDMELRNVIQNVKIINLQIELEEIKHQAVLKSIIEKYEKNKVKYDEHKKMLEKSIEIKKEKYINFVRELGKKYDVKVESMTIDPDTRIIRDL